LSDSQPKVVLVTGASGGIGRAVVAAFARDGWHVVGTDLEGRDAPREVSDYFACDLRSPEQISDLFCELRDICGHLDALVNNAAMQICKPLDETSVEEWDAIMDINLRAPFWCTRSALPLFEQAGGGAVVNVSSVHAQATSPGITAYATSKGGLTAMSRAVALELAEHNVRVNAVLPGAVDTEMLRAGLSRGHATGASTTERLDSFAQRHPLGRVARPDEIAQVVLFLCDATRSSYITGESLVVDGGVTARLSTE
jgi:NAD(P)-dependent dehydrogenase (short-subunit alcohol dehydrogenase family)